MKSLLLRSLLAVLLAFAPALAYAAKDKISDYDSTAASNEDVGGISILGTAPPSNFDNALREMMSHLADNFASDTIASATTTDLGSKAAQYLSVTGTTTITGLGTVKAGTIKFLKFDGALTLTHNGTSLIIPGAANITTAAGDVAVVVSEGSGNWRVLAYQRAATGLFLTERTAPATAANQGAVYTKDSGTQPELYFREESDGDEVQLTRDGRPAGGWELVAATAISGAADYSLTGLSAYRAVRISGWATPATDAEILLMRTSTNNGSAYDSGASDYDYQTAYGSNTTFVGARATAANMVLSLSSVGNATGEMTSFEVLLTDFNQARYLMMTGTATFINNSGTIFGGTIHGRRLQATARDAFRIFFGSGNIASGYIMVEGLRG